MDLLSTFLTVGLVGTLSLCCVLMIYSWQNRSRRGATSLTAVFFGVSMWIFSDLIQTHTPGDPMAFYGLPLRFPAIGILTAAIFLLGLEYTGRDRFIDHRLIGLLAIHPVVTFAVGISPYRSILFETRPDETLFWGYEIERTSGFYVHMGYSYGLVAVGLGLLVYMLLLSERGYRRQLMALVVAVMLPLGASVLYNTNAVAFDPTPISFGLSTITLSYAIFRLQLMDAIPVARKTVIDEMSDIVIMLDEVGNVIDVNAAGKETFGVGEDELRRSATAVFPTSFAKYCQKDSADDEIAIFLDGERRFLNVNVSTLTDYEENVLVRLLVCRDVTERKVHEQQLRQSEQELELLKDVQSRFLRHNVRNELNIVRGYAEQLAAETGPEHTEYCDRILETIDEVIERSSKARQIERIVEDAEITTIELTHVIDRAIEEIQSDYPTARIDVDQPEECWIRGHVQLEVAVENVLDNAIKHNESPEPRIDITVEDHGQRVKFRVEDNGGGIDRQEVDVLQSGEETPLQHGSGFGLWLVDRIVAKSEGTLSITPTEGGTCVSLELVAADATAQPTEVIESASG